MQQPAWVVELTNTGPGTRNLKFDFLIVWLMQSFRLRFDTCVFQMKESALSFTSNMIGGVCGRDLLYWDPCMTTLLT